MSISSCKDSKIVSMVHNHLLCEHIEMYLLCFIKAIHLHHVKMFSLSQLKSFNLLDYMSMRCLFLVGQVIFDQIKRLGLFILLSFTENTYT